LELFVRKSRFKVKIGVAKGKKLWDKRQTIKERESKREIERHK
jgi:SsrA-binding protein